MPLLDITELHERLPFLSRLGGGPTAATSTTTPGSMVSTGLATSLKIAEKVAEKASTTAANTLATSLSSINMSDGSASPHISLTHSNTSTTNSTQSSTTTTTTNNNKTSLALIITSVILILLTLTSLTAALYALSKLWQQTLNLQYLTTQLKSLLLTHNLALDPAHPNTVNTYTFPSAEMEEGGAPPYDASGDDAKSLEQSEAWPVHPGTRLGTDLPSPTPKLKAVPFLQRAPDAVARGRGRMRFQGGEEDVLFSSSRGASPSEFGERGGM